MIYLLLIINVIVAVVVMFIALQDHDKQPEEKPVSLGALGMGPQGASSPKEAPPPKSEPLNAAKKWPSINDLFNWKKK